MANMLLYLHWWWHFCQQKEPIESFPSPPCPWFHELVLEHFSLQQRENSARFIIFQHPFPLLWINLALNIIRHLSQSANVSIVRDWDRQVLAELCLASSRGSCCSPWRPGPSLAGAKAGQDQLVITKGQLAALPCHPTGAAALGQVPQWWSWSDHQVFLPLSLLLVLNHSPGKGGFPDSSLELVFELLLRKKVTTPPPTRDKPAPK